MARLGLLADIANTVLYMGLAIEAFDMTSSECI